MKQHKAFLKLSFLVFLAVCSFFLAATREAKAFSAIENLDLNTHGLILRGAWEQLSENPVFKGSRFPTLKGILGSEGVFKEKWDPFATGGSGPDVEGRSKDSEHYYNPRTKKGGAPEAVGRHYSILVQTMLAGKQTGADQAASWSAHFLADMNVPYHIVGIPAGEAEAIYIGGIDGRYPWNLKPNESGPLWLGKELPKKDSTFWNAYLKDLYSKWPGWGTTQDFERTITVFHSVRERAGQGKVFHDWFDPWYYNGWGVGIDPFQLGPVVQNSSHAKWEVWAHLEITRGNNPFKSTAKDRFHPQWENGWLSFNEKVPWKAQQVKAEEFTKKAAQSTYDEIERIYRNPRESVDDAIWRVMTLWRASLSAMKPSMEVKRQAENPAKHELKAIVENREKENVFDVKVRLTLAGDGSTFSEVKDVKGGIPASGKGDVVFTIEPRNPEKCTVTLEVIGHYEKTPDLQYARVEEPFKAIRKSQDDAQSAALTGILDALRRAAEKAESLSSEIAALCREALEGIKGAQADLEAIKSHAGDVDKRARSLEAASEEIRKKAETIRQHHLEAEQGATNEGKIAHDAEAYSKELCEAVKAIQNAQTKKEREELFGGMSSAQKDLRTFLAEGNSILERVKRNAQAAQTTLNELEALVRGLPAMSRRLDAQATPQGLEKRLGVTTERIGLVRQKMKELAALKEEAGKKYEEGKKILASLQGNADKERVRSAMDGYMGRIERAQMQVTDCTDRAHADAENIGRDMASIKEARERSEQAMNSLLSGIDADSGAVKKARETVGLTKYLAQMTGAYMERIRGACQDGAFCFTLAQDIMKRPFYVVVPDVRGKHVDAAAGILRSKNFKPQPATLGAASKIDLEFKVQSQFPAGETKAEENSVVRIDYYGQFNTRDAVANANCSRWPGSAAQWDAGRKQAVCVCPDGSSWNKTRTSCVSNRQLALDSVDCSRYPGSVPVFDEASNRAGCQCPQGFAWNRNRTHCVNVETAAVERADCSRFPGTVPMWNPQQGRAECFCPQGYMWDGSRGRCISRQEFDNYCNQIGARLTAAARANDIRSFRELLPMAQGCDFYNQALADLRNMEQNMQAAALSQMFGAIAAGVRTPQPVKPPPRPPAVQPARPPATTTTQPPPAAGGSKVDCDKKYCPICGTDNVDLLGSSVSKQCMDCRKRFATQIADCKRGGHAASTPAATVEQFKNHYVLQCVQNRWNAATKKYDSITTYAVYGPGKRYPSGSCKQVHGPDTESQCNMRAETWSRPRNIR